MPALKILRELGIEIPLIVLTGAVSEETVVRCMRMGAADYLLKDRMTRLPSAIANALDLRRERDDKRRAQRQRELSEQQYRSLFFHHPDAGLVAGSFRSEFVSVNRACAELLFEQIGWRNCTWPAVRSSTARHRTTAGAGVYWRIYVSVSRRVFAPTTCAMP